MKRSLRLVSVGAISSVLIVSAAFACGDKLVALGGGVPFDRVHAPAHPGTVILYLNPATRLQVANSDLRLESALTRAGHTVRTVGTRADLDRAIQDSGADVVLMDWADATQMDARITDKVPTLPVRYESGTGDTSLARDRCVIDADKRRAIVLLRAVNSIVEDHEKGRQVDCEKIGGRGAT